MNWETSKKPLVIAHRGFTKHHIENTLEAVEAALRLGVDGIEVDLRLSADKELIVFHDRSLARLAGDRFAGESGDVEEMTLSGLRKVLLRGSPIPTLEELLDLVKDRALLNLEIKSIRLASPVVERQLLKTLKGFRVFENILVSSFHPLPLWRLKKLSPDLKRGYLVSQRYFRTRPRRLFLKKISPFSLNPSLEMVTPGLVEKAHREGQRVFVWTVNRGDAMTEMIRVGVDGIFTDSPDLLLKRIHDGS